MQYLDHALNSSDEAEILPEISDSILSIYAAAAPEKLSHVILLSNLKNFKPGFYLYFFLYVMYPFSNEIVKK